MECAKYDDLGYRPTYGTVEIRGHEHEWVVKVTVAQGRELERDGIDVIWIFGSCPTWVVDFGLAGPYLFVHRILTFPTWFFGRERK